MRGWDPFHMVQIHLIHKRRECFTSSKMSHILSSHNDADLGDDNSLDTGDIGVTETEVNSIYEPKEEPSENYINNAVDNTYGQTAAATPEGCNFSDIRTELMIMQCIPNSLVTMHTRVGCTTH